MGQNTSMHSDGSFDLGVWKEQLFKAVRRNKLRRVQEMLDQAATNFPDPQQRVQLLSCVDWEGRTPLHVAASQDFYQVARLLIKKGADVNHVNLAVAASGSPLHEAVSNRCEPLVELLMKHGANPFIENVAGKTCMDLGAVAGGNVNILRRMERHAVWCGCVSTKVFTAVYSFQTCWQARWCVIMPRTAITYAGPAATGYEMWMFKDCDAVRPKCRLLLTGAAVQVVEEQGGQEGQPLHGQEPRTRAVLALAPSHHQPEGVVSKHLSSQYTLTLRPTDCSPEALNTFHSMVASINQVQGRLGSQQQGTQATSSPTSTTFRRPCSRTTLNRPASSQPRVAPMQISLGSIEEVGSEQEQEADEEGGSSGDDLSTWGSSTTSPRGVMQGGAASRSGSGSESGSESESDTREGSSSNNRMAAAGPRASSESSSSRASPPVATRPQAAIPGPGPMPAPAASRFAPQARASGGGPQQHQPLPASMATGTARPLMTAAATRPSPTITTTQTILAPTTSSFAFPFQSSTSVTSHWSDGVTSAGGAGMPAPAPPLQIDSIRLYSDRGSQVRSASDQAATSSRAASAATTVTEAAAEQLEARQGLPLPQGTSTSKLIMQRCNSITVAYLMVWPRLETAGGEDVECSGGDGKCLHRHRPRRKSLPNMKLALQDSGAVSGSHHTGVESEEEGGKKQVVNRSRSCADISQLQGELCVICMSVPSQAGFLHGSSVHKCVCQECASLLPPGMNCPMCRQTIERVLEVF